MSRREGTVFWRVAVILVGAQLVTGLVAAALTDYFAADQHRDLAAASLESRLDAVAEEIERRAAPLGLDLTDLPAALVQDLAYRFPDPVALVGLDGGLRRVVPPAPDGFSGVEAATDSTVVLPDYLAAEAAFDGVHIDSRDGDVEGGFAFAPLYDAAGFPVGGVLVQPVQRSLEWELADSRRAGARARIVIIAVSVLIALGLGALLTWMLVRPLRAVSDRIHSIAAGRYDTRVDEAGNDEFGRLADAVNEMASRVEQSITSLRETDRLRRELVANVGHDLRTPLAVLSGSIEEAVRSFEQGDREAAGRLLERAERQAELLGRMVDDLFELSVLERERPPLRLEPVPPAELVSDAANAHRDFLAAQGIDLQLDVEPELPPVRADGSRLLRVLNNLLSNAARHTGSGGRVRVSVRVRGGRLILEVADDGEGIPAGELDHIFERYYRAGDARTRSSERGTGLGLAIARAIAEAHDGGIRASSEAGRGTTITLDIPVAGPPA